MSSSLSFFLLRLNQEVEEDDKRTRHVDREVAKWIEEEEEEAGGGASKMN